MGILENNVSGKGIWRIIKKFLMAILFTFLCVIITGESALSLTLGLLILYLEFKFLKSKE